MAELKTPGFINYFIVGDNFLQFVDAGWHGGLYGTAHKETHGKIWLFWLIAAFTCSIVVIVLAL